MKNLYVMLAAFLYISAFAGIGPGTGTNGIPYVAPTNNNCLVGNGTAWLAGSCSTGTGTVTSVGLSLPNIFSVTNSPVTVSGTLTGSLATQTANKVWAGPSSGSAAAPTFRSLVAGDVPTLNQNTSGTAAGLSSTLSIASGGTGQTSASDAITALLPSQSGNNGKVLGTNGTAASWVSQSGGISGPGTTVSGDIVTWNSTNGTVVADGSIAASNIATISSNQNGNIYKLTGGASASVLDVQNQRLLNVNGIVMDWSVNSGGGVINDLSAYPSIDFNTRRLHLADGSTSIDWENRELFTSTGYASAFWDGVQFGMNTGYSLTTNSGTYHLEPGEYDTGTCTTAVTVNWTTKSTQLITMGGICAITFSGGVAGGTYMLRIVNDSTPDAYSFVTTIKWPGGTGPSSDANIDLISFYYDGTYWYGNPVQNFQ